MNEAKVRRLIRGAMSLGKLVVIQVNGEDLRGRPVLPRGDIETFNLDIHDGLDCRAGIPYAQVEFVGWVQSRSSGTNSADQLSA